MQPIMPSVTVTGDNPERIMARSGKIVGFSKTRVVWQFGFLAESDMARAFGVSTDGFLWILSDYAGKAIVTVGYCYALDLPARMQKIIRQ